jgi:hypothetical protein
MSQAKNQGDADSRQSLIGLFFGREDGGDMFLRKIG